MEAGDHGVLKGIFRYRPFLTWSDGNRVKMPFGIYADVDRPRRIAVGDRVVPLGETSP
jgi:hypothetical protein